MHEYLPQASNIRITQQPGRVSMKSVATVDQLIVVLPSRPRAEHWRAIPQGARLRTAMRKRSADDVPALHARLNNDRQTLVIGAKVANDTSAFEKLTVARKLVSAATTEKAGTLGILVVGFASDTADSLYEAVVAAALASEFNLPSFKGKPKPARIRRVRVLGASSDSNLQRTYR